MIDTYVIILTAIFGILISSIMFIIKSASKKTKSDAFFVNRFILIGFIFIIYLFYQKITSKKSNITTDIYIVKYEIIIATLFTICAAIIEKYLINLYDVSYVGPLLITWVILFTSIIGKIYFKEKISNLRYLGYLLIGIGIMTIASNK